MHHTACFHKHMAKWDRSQYYNSVQLCSVHSIPAPTHQAPLMTNRQPHKLSSVHVSSVATCTVQSTRHMVQLGYPVPSRQPQQHTPEPTSNTQVWLLHRVAALFQSISADDRLCWQASSAQEVCACACVMFSWQVLQVQPGAAGLLGPSLNMSCEAEARELRSMSCAMAKTHCSLLTLPLITCYMEAVGNA